MTKHQLENQVWFYWKHMKTKESLKKVRLSTSWSINHHLTFQHKFSIWMKMHFMVHVSFSKPYLKWIIPKEMQKPFAIIEMNGE